MRKETDTARISAMTEEEVFLEFETGRPGLTAKEADKRRRYFGNNTVEASEHHWIRILIRQCRSSFLYLLLAAATLALVLGELVDGVIILLFVVISIGFGFYQEYHSGQALKALKKYLHGSAKTIRDGSEMVLQQKELVPGDIVIIEAGDIVPADMRLIDVTALFLDESSLTGESMPVAKTNQTGNIAYSGTIVAEGKGLGVVIATGRMSEFGKLAEAASSADQASPFEQDLASIGSFIMKTVLITIGGIFIAHYLVRGYAPGGWGTLLLFSIALAVSVIPEGLPVVTTFALSRGALRLARQNVVVRRLSAIEDLGNIEILCTDKTGTLTENKLAVAATHGKMPERILELGVLGASKLQEGGKKSFNPFDIALSAALPEKYKNRTNGWIVQEELPFDPESKVNIVALDKEGGKKMLVMRGAPETVALRCGGIQKEEKRSLIEWLKTEGMAGRRTLAIATKERENASLLGEAKDKRWEYIGAVSFHDTLKKSAREAVARATGLGVRVKILTGDSADVAYAIAIQAGILHEDERSRVMEAADFFALPGAEQKKAAEDTAVFARTTPQEKLRIIKLLEEKYRVGFLGEGINDAPALKQASVGLVVADATDVARESADIILLKKNLETIVNGIEEGRAIFANSIKYVKATLTSNFGNFYAVGVASLLTDFLPMLPIQILLLNLVSDFPMIAIASDNVDPQEIARPHRFDIKEIALFAMALGIISTVFDFIFFALFAPSGPGALQTNWFIGSVLTELALLFSVRTHRLFWKAAKPSKMVVWLTLGAAVATLVIPFTPLGQEIFRFTRPSLPGITIIIVIAALYFATTETAKRIFYKVTAHHAA